MEKNSCSEMSNSEIKIYMETLTNEYEAKKAKIIALCKELGQLENDYQNAERELKIRKNIYL